MQIKLRIPQKFHREIESHLFPGDGFEAVAIALCGRRKGSTRHCLTVHKVVCIPYKECKVRTAERVTWSTERLLPILEEATKYDMAVLKIHSHPEGYNQFSETDNYSDTDLFGSISCWTESIHPHASAVMLPGGDMFGRAILSNGIFQPLHSIMVPGDDIKIWSPLKTGDVDAFAQRHAQLFGKGTTQRLRNLSVAVVGCSGTGSPVIEQLSRLGVGRLVLIDHDKVEEKNLNRILNTSRKDAADGRFKVEVIAEAVAKMDLGTEVETIAENLGTPASIKSVAECDIIFGCMDSVEGRHILNRISAFYAIPYFDLGVKLISDGNGGINEACGAIHYLKPDGSSLKDRHVYNLDQLKSEGLKRTDPQAYQDQLNVGYIRGVVEDRPAVISINMQIASTAINEFLARLHPYRLDGNADFAIVRVSFMHGQTYLESDPPASEMFSRYIGRGDIRPLLSMPEFSEQVREP